MLLLGKRKKKKEKRNGKQNTEHTEMAFQKHKFKKPLFLNKAGEIEESSRVR